LITLSVTTASSERSFSSLRCLKIYLRNTTGENRSNGLAVMNIHRDLVVTTDEIIDSLALKSRRIVNLIKNIYFFVLIIIIYM
jgi:hypothetical protein